MSVSVLELQNPVICYIVSSRVTFSKALPPLHTHDMPTPHPSPTTAPQGPHPSVCTQLCVPVFCVLSSWTGMDVSDTVWTISDTGWIVNIIASFLEPWTLGACTFIYFLPKFDPQTVLKVRENHPHWLVRVSSGSTHSRSWQLISIHRKTSAKIPAT